MDDSHLRTMASDLGITRLILTTSRARSDAGISQLVAVDVCIILSRILLS